MPKDKISKTEPKVQTSRNPIAATNLKPGDTVLHERLGEGIVIGFNSKTNYPDIYFYQEQNRFYVNGSFVLRQKAIS